MDARGDATLHVGVIGLGKMGISHLAIVKAHPEVARVTVCDPAGYILDVLDRYTGVKGYKDYRELLKNESLDAVVVATPSRTHGEIVRAALDRDLDVYCEKPFCLDLGEAHDLAQAAEAKGLVTQVGYHCRFLATFQEAKRLVNAGTIGRVHHVRAEAYGPVVLRRAEATWRSSKAEGGGCMYDYACHAIDLVNFVVGRPDAVSGSVLGKVFSRDVEDEVYSTLIYKDGKTGQLAVNWSDASYRKMSIKLTLWGSNGRIATDRQEVQLYLREPAPEAPALVPGWNVRYTTGLTQPVWYYFRGEEYSSQIDHFLTAVKQRDTRTLSSFRDAIDADVVADMIRGDAGVTRASTERPKNATSLGA